MNENGMSVNKNCPHCKSINKNCPHCKSINCCACSTDESRDQGEFDGLQVTVPDEHDQKLVDARMLVAVSSTESRKTTFKSSEMSTRQNSDYWLKRFMASFDKMCSFLQRRPRAVTHMEAIDTSHALASALEPPVRSSSY